MTAGNDLESARSTYEGFIRWATWGAGVIMLIVACVVGLIAS